MSTDTQLPSSIATQDILQSLAGPNAWLRLSFKAMNLVGPASQTLGALWRLRKQEVYASIKTISRWSFVVPPDTVKKHLRTLEDNHLITLERSKYRRTNTITLLEPALEMLKTDRFGICPWWIPKHLLWRNTAVLGVVLAEAWKIRKVAADGCHEFGSDWEAIAADYEDNRFRFSLSKLHEFTGLSKRSITQSRKDLLRGKCNCLISSPTPNRTDSLEAIEMTLNPAFRITKKTNDRGECTVYYHYERV